MKKRFDLTRKQPRKYCVGDIVLVRSDPPATGASRKLLPRYSGPYEVAEDLGNDRYRIRDIEGERQSRKTYQGVRAAEQIKYVATAKDYRGRSFTRAQKRQVETAKSDPPTEKENV
ncbi:hypothetical protein KPH14_012887 [Odynerus spinipes]|uniref:Uncharacterized protein n=1 Tax=Odynerus spinipes TaxID=1348599 RepID=A0AAD9RDC0_9HYME|nr:hypothetical protein KPH14_012887 [Odynerus spinipes]